jgi:hypothetical protein
MSTVELWRTAAAIAALAAAGLPAKFAVSDPASTAAAFVNRANMINWLADGERGLWIQSDSRAWFYARFVGLCHGLNSTNSLAFETGALSKIDRTTSVVVPGRGHCRVQTVVPSSGPPNNRSTEPVPQPQAQ